MNGRRLFREYAQSKGKEATEFVRIEPQQYNYDILITKDSQGIEERCSIDYKEIVHWLIQKL
jgi:hypothetical protein